FIVDAQLHIYEHNHPDRPWKGLLPGPTEITGQQMIDSMDAVGVEAALLASTWTLYRDDASYALAARNPHPDRFAVSLPLAPAGSTRLKHWRQSTQVARSSSTIWLCTSRSSRRRRRMGSTICRKSWNWRTTIT